MHTAFLWAGTFADEKAFANYASKKNCPWERDFPLDDDIIGTYSAAFRAPGDTLRDALLHLHYSPEYLDAALKKLKQQKLLDSANAVKLVYMRKKEAATVDVKAWPKTAPLRFVGQFDFNGNKGQMWHPERRTEPRYAQAGWVSIWIGTAKSPAEIDAYMEEDEYDEDADDGPTSPFGRDWKLSYDHDYLFYAGHAKALPVAKLLAKWPRAKQFATAALASADQLGITDGNFIIVAYDLDYSQKPPFSTTDPAGYMRYAGKPKAKSPLKFVGAFNSGAR